MPSTIRFAETDADIQSCFAPIQVLRPHITHADEFVAQVRRQQQQGYRMVLLEEDGAVASVAGFRMQEFLAWGMIMYIDDLVTLPGHRQHGYGQALLAWLLAHARVQGCAEIHLDSGYQRHDAHRLYLRMGFVLQSHHFAYNAEHRT